VKQKLHVLKSGGGGQPNDSHVTRQAGCVNPVFRPSRQLLLELEAHDGVVKPPTKINMFK